MAKLYPPRIEGTLPAFYGTTLVVPFIMNRVVSASEVTNMVIKIKKVNTNEVILTKYANNFSIQGNCSATFIFTEEEKNKCFSIGQFYRVQIAFVGNNNLSHGAEALRRLALGDLECRNVHTLRSRNSIFLLHGGICPCVPRKNA